MAKMRVYEIAKSLDMKSADLVKKLRDHNFEVKSAQSNVEDDVIAFILKNFAPKHETDTTENGKKVLEEAMKPVKQVHIEKKTEKEKSMIEKKKNEIEKKEEPSVSVEKTNEKKEIQSKETQSKEKVVREGNSTIKKQENNHNDRTVRKNNNNDRREKVTVNKEHSTGNREKLNSNRDHRSVNREKTMPNNTTSNSTTSNRDNTNSNKENGNTNRNSGNNRNMQNSQSRNHNTRVPNRTGTTAPKQDWNNKKDNTPKGTENNRSNTIKATGTKQEEGISRFNSSFSGKNNYNNKKGKSKNKNGNHDTSQIKKDPNRKGAFIMPKPVVVETEPDDAVKTIVLPEKLTIKELADKMKIQPSVIVKKLFLEGKMVSINSELIFEDAQELALEYDFIAEPEEKVDIIEELLKEEEEDETVMEKRPPVVCVMGHVDHGKTSLLDAIRQTNVTEREAGGITQHIGAYVVNRNGESITFLDTPGHEAFTSMRMRGAKSTDIAILVVAADDGVMPQTVEAISHAKAAGVEIIVAINKIDKPSANIERVKQELVEHELIAEDWGGSTTFVPVSAHTKEGIDELLEMILLTAEVAELKANANRKARGLVIEAQLDKGRGPVATILVQKGTLQVGDSVAIGSAYGKVRAMMDDKGRRVKEAGPSTPVEILGLNEVPDAGEIVISTENDKEARSIADAYIKQSREKLLDDTKAKLSLDGLFSQIQAGNIKELNLIIKADVQGSVEAVKQSLLKLSNDEVAIRVIHGGVGAINESDVSLASASNAIIIGFNVRPDNTAKEISEREKVDLRLYKVIYNAIEDIEAAMKGLLDPVFEEKVIGHAEVRQVFKASGVGTIAGSYVLDGKIVRGSSVRVTREGKLIYEGALASLKRMKDDVKEVASGYECGLLFDKFNDVKEFDQVEIYTMVEVPR